MRILITGIPGMGKTTLGKALESEKNFVHIDMETHGDEHALIHSNPKDFITKSVDGKKDVVISWGFRPPDCTQDILFLKSQEFKVIWLDGNRDAAYNSYKTRVEKQDSANLEHHLENFHKQIERIEKTNVIQEIDPIIINTFDSKGNFRNLDEILEEVAS